MSNAGPWLKLSRTYGLAGFSCERGSYTVQRRPLNTNFAYANRLYDGFESSKRHQDRSRGLRHVVAGQTIHSRSQRDQKPDWRSTLKPEVAEVVPEIFSLDLKLADESQSGALDVLKLHTVSN